MNVRLGAYVQSRAVWEHVAKVMDAHELIAKPSLEELIDADEWARGL